MKKFFCIILMVLALNMVTFADSKELDVVINGYHLMTETSHETKDETNYVVCKDIIQALNGKVEWYEAVKMIKIVLDDKVLIVGIDSLEASFLGDPVTLDHAPFIKDGRAMMPIDLLAKYFDLEIRQYKDSKALEIYKEGLVLEESSLLEKGYSADDLYWLSRIVRVESGDQDYEMALAIANTVMNRVKDHRFPNTVADVIFQVDRYVQFPPAHKASFKTLEPSEMSLKAAKAALEGHNNIGYSLYFNNAPFKSKAGDLIKVIHGEYFYK